MECAKDSTRGVLDAFCEFVARWTGFGDHAADPHFIEDGQEGDLA